MMRWLADLWLGSAPVEFESSFGMQESVERLRAATRRFHFLPATQQEAVGAVTESRVSVQRQIPMKSNAFKPFYRGRFIERNGKVVLTGRFNLHWFTKAFMTLWFGLLVCFAVPGSVLAALHHQNAMHGALGSVAMLAAGISLVFHGKWLTHNDPAWLSEVIRGALCAQGGAPGARAGAANRIANSSASPS